MSPTWKENKKYRQSLTARSRPDFPGGRHSTHWQQTRHPPAPIYSALIRHYPPALHRDSWQFKPHNEKAGVVYLETHNNVSHMLLLRILSLPCTHDHLSGSKWKTLLGFTGLKPIGVASLWLIVLMQTVTREVKSNAAHIRSHSITQGVHCVY